VQEEAVAKLRNQQQRAGGCVDITRACVAALDAADATALVAAVVDRPMCPQVEQTDSAVAGFVLPDGRHIGLGVWGEDCEPCARAVRAIEAHALLRYRTPQRRDFLAALATARGIHHA
jgi:hypothetical protein